MKKILIPIILLVLIIEIGGYVLSKQYMNNNSPSTQNNTITTSSNKITIENFSFNPSTLTIKKGDTVTWTNLDSATHTVNSSSFNSSNLTTGQSFSFTFNSTGTFDYTCDIHPSMKGQIIVQ